MARIAQACTAITATALATSRANDTQGALCILAIGIVMFGVLGWTQRPRK
jgi:hypothetical protein